MDKEDVVHACNIISLSHNKNEIMPFAATWMQLDVITLSEVSQRKTNIISYHLYVQELHEFLFDDEDYECSATVKEYSNDISVLSGLTEASRDVAAKNSVIGESGGEADVVI